MSEQRIILKSSVRTEEFDTSYKEKRYLLFCENRKWQINEFLYRFILQLQKGQSLEGAARELSAYFNRKVTTQELSNIAKAFLIRRGIVEGEEEAPYKNSKNSDYFWFKLPLISGSIIERFKFLKFLFLPKVAFVVLLFMLVSYIMALKSIIGDNGMNFADLLKLNMKDYAGVLSISLFAVLFHEIGHMTALMKNNMKPGCIGFALYLTTPVFYSDVNNAWKLKRKQRIVVDVGGVYFQGIFLAIICAVGILIQSQSMMLSFIMGLIFIANNFNPFIKFDGYWIVSDLLGIPNLHYVTKSYLEERLLRVFGIKVQKSVTRDILQKERKLFEIYVMLTAIYVVIFTCALLGLCRVIAVKLASIIYLSSINTLTFNKAIDFISKNAGVLFTAILLARIAYMTFSKLIKDLVVFVLRLKKINEASVNFKKQGDKSDKKNFSST